MKIRSIIAIVIVAAMVSCAARPRKANAGTTEAYPDSLRSYYLFTDGLKQYLIHGNNEKALQDLAEVLKEDTTFAPAYYHSAEVLLSERKPGKAADYSRKAVALDSLNTTYRSQLGRALIMSGDYDAALGIYNNLTKQDPHNPVNYRMLAALYDYKKLPFTAIAILDSAEFMLGRIEELSMFKRQLLMSVALYDKAIEETEALIAEYPYDEDNYTILGDLYSAMNRDSLAMVNYREAIRLDSTNINTLTSLADFYQKKNNENSHLQVMRRIFANDQMELEYKKRIFNDLALSVDYYQRNYFNIHALATTLLTHYPNDYGVLELYATHLIRSGELQQALEVYKSYISANPDTLQPYFEVIGIETYLQRPDSVTKYSGLALGRFPKNTSILINKGYAHAHMEDFGQARKTFEDAYRSAQDDSTRSVIRGVIGDMYHQQGNNKKAFAEYRKALNLDRDNVGVLNNYSYFLSEADQELERALRMSTRANELEPGNSTYLDTQGWVLYKLGRYEEAKKVIHNAIAFDRTGSEVLLMHYGDILFKLEDYFMAEVYWKRALDRGHDPEEVEQRLKLIGK